MAKNCYSNADEHKKRFITLLKSNTGRYHEHEVFSDFCEVAAISLSNSVDRLQYQEREKRYLDIIKRYEKDEQMRFAEMLACIVNALECGFDDVLGAIFMALELGSHWKGQFFTPYHISLLMAQLLKTDVDPMIEEQGFFTLYEPTVGGGGMVIAAAQAAHEAGVNYQQAMHVVAVDVDITAVHMTYIQLSLLYVPAIVIHGNSLTNETWSHWATPAHVLGFWDSKLRRKSRIDEQLKPARIEPVENLCKPIIQERITKTEQLYLF